MLTQNDQNRLVARGRDEMMTAFCKVANPNEAQQREASERFISFMQDLVPQIVGVVAVGDYPAVAVKLENMDGKGKISLKAMDVDEAGPMLITRVGSSMTLVLTAAEQFDRQRPAANIDPDQRSLLPDNDEGEGDEDGEQQEEDGEDDATEVSTNLEDLFSTVEATPGCWTVLHGGVEIFTALAADEFANDLQGHLTDTAKELGRDLTPFEVRDRALVVLGMPQHQDIGLAFAAPYTPEGISAAASAPVEPEKPASKAGRKSQAEKVAEYHAGYDAAEAGASISDCPHARGAFKEEWQRGWADQKDGKARAWERPTPAPANDDVATETEAA